MTRELVDHAVQAPVPAPLEPLSSWSSTNEPINVEVPQDFQARAAEPLEPVEIFEPIDPVGEIETLAPIDSIGPVKSTTPMHSEPMIPLRTNRTIILGQKTLDQSSFSLHYPMVDEDPLATLYPELLIVNDF